MEHNHLSRIIKTIRERVSANLTRDLELIEELHEDNENFTDEEKQELMLKIVHFETSAESIISEFLEKKIRRDIKAEAITKLNSPF